LCGGRLSDVIHYSHVACIVVSRGVMSLGSFLCTVFDRRSRMALRVSREVLREVLGPVLSPFGSLAMMTLVGWIYREYSSLGWRCIVRRLLQSCSPSSHRATRWLSSLLEYCIGLHCWRTILSYSFVPSFPCSEGRFSWRALSTALDASRMLVYQWHCRCVEMVGDRIPVRVCCLLV
jgi:hypothetical protein